MPGILYRHCKGSALLKHGSTSTVRRLGVILGGTLLCLALFQSGAFGATVKHASTALARTPEGAVNKICNECHSTEVVMETPKDYDDWHDTIQRMIDRGAKGTPEEFDLVAEFLYENMTTVDVNHSDADTLGVVLNAPDNAVAAILARRQTRPFKNLADLENIRGLNVPALEAKKRMIFFN
jgi:hypothetical protein